MSADGPVPGKLGRVREKLIAAKEEWAAARRRPSARASGPANRDRAARTGSDRLPPGQHLVRDWPVLDLGITPAIDRADWRLSITGLVEQPLTIDWAGFLDLPNTQSRSDIHCVTSWSIYDNDWDGVAMAWLLDQVRPKDGASHALIHGYDGYTTNLTLDDLRRLDVLLAWRWQGAPLAPEHGGPVRLVIPHLYFWKSAKWVQRIEIFDDNVPGFWEVRGYHDRGDPWKEERYE